MTIAPEKNPGIGSSDELPRAVPHDPDAPHVRSARVTVDASVTSTPLTAIWASLGFDEINWTYTATGKNLLSTISDFSAQPFHVRPHYIFNSGSGFGLPHWGSGNVYHETSDGTPFYDFTIVDQTYDAIVNAGNHILVELGFTPRDLLPDRAFTEFTIIDSPTVYSAYEAGQWSYPPKDYAKWGGLVAALAQHSLDRYGEEEVSSWLWELWNEPDIFYWRGTQKEFFDLYAVTVAAVRGVLPHARVGGPSVSGGQAGVEFTRNFLGFVEENDLPLDFVSFHTKGSSFTPWRTYGPTGAAAPEKQSPSTGKMIHEVRAILRVMAEFPQFAKLPAIVDECDAGVPSHWGIYDNSNFEFQNNEYYPVFQVNLMKKLLDLGDQEGANIQQATTWSFYCEGERYFEGTRTFITAGGIEKPFMNAYRMLGRLDRYRLPVVSDAAWSVDRLDDTLPGTPPEEVDALASRSDDGRVSVLVYRRTDDQYQASESETPVTVTIKGLNEALQYTRVHHRIDGTHSNSHTIWKSLGSPQDPSPEQLAEIKSGQGLEELEPASVLTPVGGILTLEVSLPLTAVSLLEFEPVPA
jgi:xylan 1,4-beta-xylosidase